MSRMKDVYAELTDGIGLCNARIEALDHKIDQLLHLMREMVHLEGAIERMEVEVKTQLDRMEKGQTDSVKLVDRLIEMSMVVKGQGEEAVTHRAQSRLDTDVFDQPQTIEDERANDEWPPAGCDTMDVIG